MLIAFAAQNCKPNASSRAAITRILGPLDLGFRSAAITAITEKAATLATLPFQQKPLSAITPATEETSCKMRIGMPGFPAAIPTTAAAFLTSQTLDEKPSQLREIEHLLPDLNFSAVSAALAISCISREDGLQESQEGPFNELATLEKQDYPVYVKVSITEEKFVFFSETLSRSTLRHGGKKRISEFFYNMRPQH